MKFYMKKMVQQKLSSPLVLLLFFLLVLLVNNLQVESSSSSAQTTTDDKSNSSSTSDDLGLKGKLTFVHVIFRHGDRTPIEPYPTDPWKNVKDWPTGWGQLTNLGKQQHYDLGQWLRKRYNNLLGPTYSKDEIYIRSTDVDRTLMSALSNLAGLYPPAANEVWNNNILWQPIPVHTEPEYEDAVLAAKAPCPAYDYLYSSLMDTPEFEKLNERFAYLYKYLSKYTGREVNTLDAIQRINNTLFIESLYNKTLPAWTKEVYPSVDMTFVSDLAFSLYTYTRQMARLKTGPLIKEILQRFDQKAKGKLNPDRNVWIYSAHDTTVGNVLNTLKIYDMHSPAYTACIMLELRIDENQKPFVSVFYKSSPWTESKLLKLPGCDVACPLNQMFSLYKDILPTDWETECKFSTLMMTYEDADVGTAMGVLVAIITMMLFLSYLTMLYYRRRSYRTYSSYSQVA